jgi:polyhydroxyalkanoate synthesis regulator phasin
METITATEPLRDSKVGRENVLRDFVRFSWKATRGLTGAAEVEGESLVRKMVDIGRVTPEQGDRLMAMLRNRMVDSRRTFERRVDGSIRQAVEKVAEISARELTRVTERIAELEKRLERLPRKQGGR